MALPFYLPGEDAELHLRRLERLLRELYHVLHALLAGGATVRGPARDRQPPPPPPPGPGSAGSALSGLLAGSSGSVHAPSSPDGVQTDPRVTPAPPAGLFAPRLPTKPAAPASSPAVGVKPPPGARAARLAGGRISLQFDLAGTSISFVTT